MSTPERSTKETELPIPATLVVVAPRNGSGGVGDYAEDFANEATNHFDRFAEVRTGGPGQVGVRQVFRDRRVLKDVLDSSRKQGPVVLHFELSAGSLSPFWLAAGNRGTVTTATVHDPPFTVWWPFRTQLMSKSRLLHHGLHYPLRRLSAFIERVILRGVTLFALSDLGSEALKVSFPSCEVLTARHFVPKRPVLEAPAKRPLAVGLFGHAYKGKGFDKLVDLRLSLPSHIAINVAGRGTEKLPPVEGVNVLGGVDAEKEDEFFKSVRAILLPYANTSRYGHILSVSGVAARAFAYGTPVVAANSGTLAEAATDGGVVTASNTIADIAESAYELITDDSALGLLAKQTEELRESRGLKDAVLPFVVCWGSSVSRISS